MNYIGSKVRLLPFLEHSIKSVLTERLEEQVFCDLFAGTGAVGRYFKPKCKAIISNDLEYYSYVLNRNYVGNSKLINVSDKLEELDKLTGIEGFVFRNYSRGGHGDRNYFTDQNAKRIDVIRQQIESWKSTQEIDEDIYFFLLASLLESADKVANTASVYGAYLKHIKKSAQQDLTLKPATFDIAKNNSKVYQSDANELIKKISGDILYLDPPYNARQYGSNYHLLNTIASYQSFDPKGVTGLPVYNKSDYCSKATVVQSFEDLIANAKFEYVFLSYNNEGLMMHSQILSIMEKYGEVQLKTQAYQRFKADKTENRNHKATETLEYLFCLQKY
jgi:adenine-specific DNA-methyltransferase